ncbi:uncharacterized protein LOC124821503 [Vigna umbellata]|uniref:uncharacterized protein LOC124821503 n=1 Tax=Vigna umbellata TaxID=87088 RepID=UPI001F5F867E|nr:uncharacterized protein LOC124821503 [Vigna umbellata]
MQRKFPFQKPNIFIVYCPDRKVPKVYGMLPFDVEACHQIIPKILPWNFPSELSQLIEKEVAKSIATMDENSCLQVLDVNFTNTDYVGNKRKRIKRSLTDCNGFESQQSAIPEFSNCSGSPVTSSWQKGQSKHVVMCSANHPNNAHSLDVHEEVHKRHSLESNTEYLLKFQKNETYPSTSFCKSASSVLERETAYDACLNETHKSFYESCFPGKISVPETAIQSGIKPMTGPVSSCSHADSVQVSLNNELTPITFNVCQSSDKLQPNSDPFANTEIPESSFTKAAVQNFRDGNMKTTAVSNVTDECSHADSTSNSKSFDSSSSVPMDMVQKLWRELRVCQKDSGQHANPEQLNVIQVLKLTSGLTDLISEADLLFRNHQQKQCGIMEPPMNLFEEATKSWYDEQMMMSTVAVHGFSFYAKHISDVGSKFGSKNEVDLISEMLASTTNVMGLGKLSRQDQTKSTSIYANKLFETNDPTNDTKRTSLSNVMRSIIPERSSLSVKGLALSEYMSSVRQMSISEGFRIPHGSENKRKRRKKC